MNDLMPREKAIEYGISSLSNTELLALIIKSAYKNKNVFDLSNELIEVAGGFNNLPSLSYEELINIKGIKQAKALELMAILEISKRLSKLNHISDVEIKSPEKLIDYLRFSLGFSTCEEFMAIFLNNSGKLIKAEVLFKGSISGATIGIDEILRKAILLKATGIIVAHNHPSNKCIPSSADIEITNNLNKACNMMGIKLIDHIIVGSSSHFSFKTHSMLK